MTKNRQNIRKKLSILFLCLFGIVLAGCEKQIAQPIDNDTDYEMGAWFVGDNKYIAEQGDSNTIDTWRKHKLTSIETKGINNDTSNILNGNGPGPNGAQWNGDAPITVASLISVPKREIKKLEILINNTERPIKQVMIKESLDHQKTIIYWTLENRHKYLEPIEKDDIPLLYEKEKVQAFEDNPSSFIASLDTGEIFTITVNIYTDSKHTITKIFHIVYGE